MDGPPQARPPMSAPLLLWVVLLRWASGGGFARPGRTWQHCTGRSEGGWAVPGDRAHPVLPWLGRPTLPGQTPEGELCFGEVSFGGGQPSPGVSVLGVHSSGVIDRCCRLPAPMDSRMWGHSPACSPHSARGEQPACSGLWGELCLSLLHKRCPRFCWRQRGGEGNDWKKEKRAMKCPRKVPPALDSSDRHSLHRPGVRSFHPEPKRIPVDLPSHPHACAAWAAKPQLSFWDCLGPGSVCLGLVQVRWQLYLLFVTAQMM